MAQVIAVHRSLYLVKELAEFQFLSAPVQLIDGEAHLHWQRYVQRTAAYLHTHASHSTLHMHGEMADGNVLSRRLCRPSCQPLWGWGNNRNSDLGVL